MRRSFLIMRTMLTVCCLVVLWAGAVRAADVQEGGSALLLDSIAAQSGKPVLVNFFASWCPPCKEEIPGLVSLRSQYAADDVAIIGVSLDESRSALDRMIQDFGINYPVIRGNRELAGTFGVTGIPRLLVYSAEGKLVSDHLGYMTEEELRQLIDANIVK
ncbi:alkyl hydroperoxide reductase/ Thiol specific antioxidant/ Mal allergen [Oleidesulfovibrio alaskensis G20]|jgi:thiol-disulfide isomerase/thioredoxin|uniref:Alkyl hydroperoxide reductase/ Thiol specific antioxidant/ Mal allergen n=1 Tax=Oleidesulfovibrio alaskensis (strain ATCC BAA-1058 / DSM 17464 / G20) TaxID=207559 RepID=Q30ZI5_OLEA2|nr:TlpA disulfide reductase family protein [Oleidesulfovibrio alaskensis]ABB38911.1 alkyl hydroperoxide reductase/ Thiol specific antioxidant/ Mal allergen [Oleidesulfovibrio alaskensis G20]MBG0772300.1 TlpA family protein disulfide reductase [Oleidesulfovibrio alaskensis]MBL3581048.1 TlpA family protein disulfide reductase [Oleidesulfovibrio alaskensis]